MTRYPPHSFRGGPNRRRCAANPPRVRDVVSLNWRFVVKHEHIRTVGGNQPLQDEPDSDVFFAIAASFTDPIDGHFWTLQYAKPKPRVRGSIASTRCEFRALLIGTLNFGSAPGQQAFGGRTFAKSCAIQPLTVSSFRSSNRSV